MATISAKARTKRWAKWLAVAWAVLPGCSWADSVEELTAPIYAVLDATDKDPNLEFRPGGLASELYDTAMKDIVEKEAATNPRLKRFDNAEAAADAKLDLSVPDSPAFKALGISPEEVIRPQSPRAVALELLNGIDPNGNFQNGFAMDFAPYMTFAGNAFNLQEYRERSTAGFLRRFAARTQLSLAASKGSSDEDEATRLAAGIRFVPWDRQDPRMDNDLIGCLQKARNHKSYVNIDALTKSIEDNHGKIEDAYDDELEQIKNRLRQRAEREARDTVRSNALVRALDAAAAGNAELRTELNENRAMTASAAAAPDPVLYEAEARAAIMELNAKYSEQVEKLILPNLLEIRTNVLAAQESCELSARGRDWNGSGWAFGVAPTFISDETDSDEIEYNSTSLWMSFAYGFEEIPGLEDSSQLVLSVRHIPEEMVPNPNGDGTQIEQDTSVAAAQLRFGVKWLESRASNGLPGDVLSNLGVGPDESAPNLILSLEVDYTSADRKGGLSNDESFRYAVAADFKIPQYENAYLKLTAGNDEGDDELDGAFVLGNVRVGF